MSAAAATTRLRVGTNVLNNDFRHPVLVAREAATADLLTDGRLQIGLGAGHMKSEYDGAGLRFDAGGARVARLAEAVTIVKSLLNGEEVTFTGKYYRVTGHMIHPLPVQRPTPRSSSEAMAGSFSRSRRRKPISLGCRGSHSGAAGANGTCPAGERRASISGSSLYERPRATDTSYSN
jgi:hypothetical protein